MTIQPADRYVIFWLALGMLVSSTTGTVISIKASNHAIREAERGQCDGLQADIDTYLEVPPVTAAGINQLRSKQERLRVLGCPVPKD